MCYDTAQLAYRIYKDAKRMMASPEEIESLRRRWKKLAGDDEPDIYHASGFNHPGLFALSIESSKLDIDLYTWGLIPHWVKEETQAKEIWNKTINARGETIFEKPSFRDAAKSNRVIVPLDGFFEHHHKAGKAYPYFIRRKDKERLLVAGLASQWMNENTGEILKTMTIVTTKGNELLTRIHNNPKLKESRMPLILNDQDTAEWLQGDEVGVKELIRPNDEVELESFTVRRLRGKNYVGNSEKAQQEYVYEELIEPPTLF